MSTYQLELVVDLGTVGYRGQREPFRIRLDTQPLIELIRDARRAYRVYELLLIDRPGDIWDYVRVIPESIPASLRSRISQQWEKARSTRTHTSDSASDQQIPFNVFDRLFYWAGDDTEPEDRAWLGQRDAPSIRSFANSTLAVVRQAQQNLGSNDHLIRHIVRQSRDGELAYCYLGREAAKQKSRRDGPLTEPAHTPDFYRKLEQVLRDPELTSVAYVGNGDHEVLRKLATEQRRRANLSGHRASHALHLSATVNQCISNEAWDSEIAFLQEGIAHGDLLIQGAGLGCDPKIMVEQDGRVPGRYILSARDEGSISGFERTTGDGWFLYTSVNPDSRRLCLEKVQRWFTPSEPVLAFADMGAAVFQHEKAVIFVGEAVSREARLELALVVADWQKLGESPLVIVEGRATEFHLAKAANVFEVPPHCDTSGDRSDWLKQVLLENSPWVDVLIGLDMPSWVGRTFAGTMDGARGLWSPWVVVAGLSRGIKNALQIEEPLSQYFAGTHRKAVGNRSLVL